MLQILEDQDACAFAEDETITVLVPGTARGSGVIVAGGKRAHGGESAYAHRRNGGFGASSNHHVSITALDDLVGVADGVRASGAGGACGLVRPTCVEPDAHMPGG